MQGQLQPVKTGQGFIQLDKQNKLQGWRLFNLSVPLFHWACGEYFPFSEPPLFNLSLVPLILTPCSSSISSPTSLQVLGTTIRDCPPLKSLPFSGLGELHCLSLSQWSAPILLTMVVLLQCCLLIQNIFFTIFWYGHDISILSYVCCLHTVLLSLLILTFDVYSVSPFFRHLMTYLFVSPLRKTSWRSNIFVLQSNGNNGEMVLIKIWSLTRAVYAGHSYKRN